MEVEYSPHHTPPGWKTEKISLIRVLNTSSTDPTTQFRTRESKIHVMKIPTKKKIQKLYAKYGTEWIFLHIPDSGKLHEISLKHLYVDYQRLCRKINQTSFISSIIPIRLTLKQRLSFSWYIRQEYGNNKLHSVEVTTQNQTSRLVWDCLSPYLQCPLGQPHVKLKLKLQQSH